MQNRDHTTEKIKYKNFLIFQFNATGELLVPGIDDVSNLIAGILSFNNILDLSTTSRSRDSQRLISGNNI
jgi:hypothetical protein